MNTSRNLAALGCVAAAALAASPSFAQDSGWYAGGSIGGSAATIDNDRITSGLAAQGLTTTGLSDHDRDTAYSLFGGYQLNRNFGIEGGWFDLGRMGFNATTAPAGTLTGDVRLNGVNLDLVGTLPLTNRLSLLGRVGAAYVQTRGSFASTGAVLMPYSGSSTSARHTGLEFGAGLAWRVNEAWELRAEAKRLRVDDSVGNKGDVDVMTVGVVYHFGGAAATHHAAAPAAVAAAPAAQPLPSYVAPPAPPAPAFVPSEPVTVRLSADALFDFDRSTLRTDGERQLDALASDPRKVRFDEVVVGECRGNEPTAALIACLQPDRRVDVQVEGRRDASP